MSKLKVTLFYILKVCFYIQTLSTKRNYLYVLTFFQAIKHNNIFDHKKPDPKYLRYWLCQDEGEVIQLADKLFSERKYIDVYELLNRQKFDDNLEIKWRIARSLFFLSEQDEFSKCIKQEMIYEANDILKKVLDRGEENANIHKWMAIVINYTSGYESLEARVKKYPIVKEHLIKAAALNPNDFCVHYMLGKLCYDISSLSRFQRLIAKYFYVEAPEATYEEAYKFLMKAEDLHPRSFLPNIYYLGQVCLKMKMFYRAKYYFTLMVNLPVIDKSQEKYSVKSKLILDKLEKFDLGKDVLFCTFFNGYGFTDD